MHFHVFERGYPHVPDPLYTFPDGTVPQYLALCEVLGIERTVPVQPTFCGTDNSLTLDTLRRIGPTAGRSCGSRDTTDAELDRVPRVGGCGRSGWDLFVRRSWAFADLIAYVRRMAVRASRPTA